MTLISKGVVAVGSANSLGSPKLCFDLSTGSPANSASLPKTVFANSLFPFLGFRPAAMTSSSANRHSAALNLQFCNVTRLF